VGTRSYAARSNNCKAAILAANTNERRASSARPSTPSCLRPTFTRFTYSPKSVAARRFSHQAMNLLECGGNRSATPLSSGSQASRITWRTGGSHQVGKSAVAASLCRRCPKKCDQKVSPNRFRRQLANDVPQNPANASKEIIVLRSAR
jgi:hypothetical protein